MAPMFETRFLRLVHLCEVFGNSSIRLKRLESFLRREEIGSKLTQSQSHRTNRKSKVQVCYHFILKISSVTYVEIFQASSIQFYLTFKAFLKESVECNFFKS